MFKSMCNNLVMNCVIQSLDEGDELDDNEYDVVG